MKGWGAVTMSNIYVHGLYSFGYIPSQSTLVDILSPLPRIISCLNRHHHRQT